VNKLSQLLGAAAVIAIAVVFILQFRPATGAKVSDTGPRCLAEVHGTCIPTHVFQAAYRAIVRGGDGNVARQMHMKEQTANGLIEMQLLNDDAKRLGIAVSDDDVSREFIAGRMHVSVPAKETDLVPRLGLDGFRATHDPRDWYQFIPVKGKDKKFDKKQFEKMVRRTTSLSPTDFRDWQTKELLAARMRDLIRSRARVSEEEVFEQFARDKSTATIDYVKFDYRWYIELVDASPKKVDEWAEKNQELLNKTWESRKSQYLPECRVTRHILVKLDETTASDEEKAAAHKKIDAAADRIKKGEDFAKVAKEISDDPGSAVNGGELGCVPKGQMVKPFEDAMQSLAAGQVSGVVQSQFGLHLVKVEQIAKDADAEKIGKAATAKDLFQKTEVSRLSAEGAKEVLAAVRGGKTIKDATATYITEMTAAQQKAAADKKDAAKDAKADDGGKKDKKKKKGDKDKADDKKDEDKKDAAPAGPAESELRPQVETSLPFTMNGDPIPGAHGPNEVAKIAFGLKNAGDLPDDVVAYDGGFVVIQLKEKTPATREEFAKNREEYMSVFRRDKGQEALVIYMKRLSANLDAAAKPLPALVAESKPSADGEQQAPMPMDDDGE
jgi:peptidyl-prolyl cis-trans isomerase D